MKERNRSTAGKGFTLVELLVVIGIIALLISILLPSLNKAREAATTLQCAAQMRNLTNAVFMYAGDNKGSLPPTFACYTGSTSATTFATPWFGGETGRKFLYDDAMLTKYNIKSNAIRICPKAREINPQVDDKYLYWNYRYNAVLGGTNYTNPADTYASFVRDAANNAWARPLRIGFRNSSITILFGENTGVGTWAALTTQQFRLDAVDPVTNQQRLPTLDIEVIHNVKYTGRTFWVPWAPNLRPTKIGTANLAFGDGSVRSVRRAVDKHPLSAWGDAGELKVDPRR